MINDMSIKYFLDGIGIVLYRCSVKDGMTYGKNRESGTCNKKRV